MQNTFSEHYTLLELPKEEKIRTRKLIFRPDHCPKEQNYGNKTQQ
jgi:hypothetical protein